MLKQAIVLWNMEQYTNQFLSQLPTFQQKTDAAPLPPDTWNNVRMILPCTSYY